MTDEKLWKRPLIIAIGSVKYVVKSTRDAAWLLADKWPVLTGESFVRALKACAASSKESVAAGTRGKH